MKPIVIYPTSQNEKISLTKQEFEDYLKQAYDSGYADGYNSGSAVNKWWTTPVTIPTNTPTITWENPSVTPLQTITCDAHNDL